MARGKIQIKKIENQTNRQVTYSKRRNELFKKAKELAVLCDSTVSVVMISASNQHIYEHHSPGTTMKQIYDRYQKVKEVDLWVKQYQKMQGELEKLNEINRGLQKDIRRKMGGCLVDLTFKELLSLEEDVETFVKLIRERMWKKLGSHIDTGKQKKRNAQGVLGILLQQIDLSKEEREPHYGLVDNGEYNPVVGYNDNP